MLPNDEGVAPGAVVESVYVLPGVPAEMEAMFERVGDEFEGTRTYTETVATPEAESTLLDRIAAVQSTFDVTVGSYPGDHVRLKLSGSDPETVQAAAAWLGERVESLEE
jgi:molybdopterin-biosynthesis enzyme MoeA-like protein